MKAKLFTKDMVFIDVIDISQLSFKRQRNKEYTISCKPIADKDYNWEQVSFIYFLDDNEEKTKRIQYKPCGYLEGYNGESLSIKSMESYLESISVIPENFEWWQNKLLKNVLPDLCYGFRRIKKASLSEMQDVATSYHVKFDVLENGNGEVYADTGYYFSPSNTHELYYYSDGYVIYRIILPEEARRQGLVLRWSDQTGTTTDVSVQFRWSNVSSDFTGTYSAEQSPLRGEGSRKNETVGVDVPESDNTYLFIKFNLKYDTGSTSVFPKGYNYEQEITTVQGEGEENYVYYGKTAILNAFEVIYRVDTRIEEGTISVSDTQLMQADLSNCNSLLSVLKAISEAYKLTFFVSFEENIPLLNVYNEYINDTTNQTIITDKVNSTVTRKEIKTETLQAVEAFGIGNGFDRIHAFVKADDLESNIKNIGKYEGEETSVEELITNAKAYIEKENEELSSASFEYYNMPLQVNDKVRVVINKNVYTSLITEENYSFDGDKTKKEYTIGIRKYAFSGFFTSPFSGLFLYKPEAPTNLIATRMEQGWTVSWQGRTQRYILQYRRSSTSPWNTISVTGTSCTIPFTEYDIDYTFAIYAVDDRGQYSDAMYIYSNSLSEAIYVWETYHDGDTQPDTPTGSGITGGWHRDLTQNAKWVSKKEAHRITEGSWSVPVLTSNGVRLGVLDDTPDDVTGLAAVAMKDGIQISCNAMGVGAKNVVSSFEFELLLEGESEWIPISSFTNSAFYTFNRSTIGYPEASDLDGSQVRCKVKNTYNYYSTNYATASVNIDSYGTWNVLPPEAINAQSANRAVNVTWQRKDKTPLGKDIYGITFFDIQISKDGTNWYKPAQGKTGKVSEDDWKDGTGYLRLSGGGWSQSLPLTGQTLGLPVNTTYYYRVRTRGISDDYLSAWSNPVTAIALATGIGDIIEGAVKEAQLDDSSVSNIKIKDGTIVASEKVVTNSITTELLNVLAKNKINNFSITGTLDGWTTTGTLEDDASGFKKLRFTNSGFLSNVFTVQPNEICSFEFGISCPNYTSLSGAFIAFTLGQTIQSYIWSPSQDKWVLDAISNYAYFLKNYKDTAVKYFKTYILGSKVNITDIPAPSTTDATYPLYALQLQGSDTTARIRAGFNAVTAGTYWELYLPQVYSGQGGKIVAQQIITPSLSAINVNAGVITSGILRAIIKAGESKPNVFLDLDTEEFRVGNEPSLEESNHEDAEYLHWKPNVGLFLKLKNLIVDALASTIRGRFRIRGTTAEMSQSVLIVNPESTADPDTNTPANTTDIKTAVRCPVGITGDLTGNADTATLATQANEIKPLGNSITLTATPTSVTKIIKIATVNCYYTGTFNIRCNGATIEDAVKIYINGLPVTESGVRVVYGKNNTAYGIKKIVVTSDTSAWNSNRQIYAEIVTYANNPPTTRLGVVETNAGSFTPSMTEVSSVEGTVVDSLSLSYRRGDISSYNHVFTKNITGNVTGDVTGNATLTNLDVNAKASFGDAGLVNATGTTDAVTGTPAKSAYFPNLYNQLSTPLVHAGTINQTFNDDFKGMAEIDGRLYAIGIGRQAYSDDKGLTWTMSLYPDGGHYAIINSNGRLIVCGNKGDGTGRISYSDDKGYSWTAVFVNRVYNALTEIEGRIIAVAGGGNSGCAYSDDRGVTWNYSHNLMYSIYGVTEVKGRLIAVGNNTISYSDDKGVTWTRKEVSGDYRDIIEINGRVIAITNIGLSSYSDDKGLTWSSPVDNYGGGGVTKIGNRIIAAGAGGISYTDNRGETWSSIPSIGFWKAIASIDNCFAVLGQNSSYKPIALYSDNAFAGLVASKLATARNITISDADGTNKGIAVSVDGSEDETLKLPATIKANVTGNLTGNADTATTATTATTASNGFINIKQSASFTLGTYDDGTHVSVANTHATNTITCTLPTGQTMNGQSSFTIAPDTLLEFRLIDTKWKCVSNEWEHIVTYTAAGAKSNSIGQYRTLRLELYNSAGDLILTSIPTIAPIITMGFMLGAESGSHYIGGVTIACNTSTKTITSFELYYWQRFSFGSLKIYGMK